MSLFRSSVAKWWWWWWWCQKELLRHLNRDINGDIRIIVIQSESVILSIDINILFFFKKKKFIVGFVFYSPVTMKKIFKNLFLHSLIFKIKWERKFIFCLHRQRYKKQSRRVGCQANMSVDAKRSHFFVYIYIYRSKFLSTIKVKLKKRGRRKKDSECKSYEYYNLIISWQTGRGKKKDFFYVFSTA